MEAGSAAHHWCRELRTLGHEARIIDPRKVKPFRIGGPKCKNDINDASAICEAAGRPHMRLAPVKTADRQAILVVHRMRAAAVDEHKRIANQLRGLLGESGISSRGLRWFRNVSKSSNCCRNWTFMAARFWLSTARPRSVIRNCALSVS